jgi:hypothetical protein
MGYLLKGSKPPEIEIKEVERYVETVKIIEVLPPLPDCSNFNFDHSISGISGDKLIILTAKLYQWGSNCSNALRNASND